MCGAFKNNLSLRPEFKIKGAINISEKVGRETRPRAVALTFHHLAEKICRKVMFHLTIFFITEKGT